MCLNWSRASLRRPAPRPWAILVQAIAEVPEQTPHGPGAHRVASRARAVASRVVLSQVQRKARGLPRLVANSSRSRACRRPGSSSVRRFRPPPCRRMRGPGARALPQLGQPLPDRVRREAGRRCDRPDPAPAVRLSFGRRPVPSRPLVHQRSDGLVNRPDAFVGGRVSHKNVEAHPTEQRKLM